MECGKFLVLIIPSIIMVRFSIFLDWEILEYLVKPGQRLKTDWRYLHQVLYRSNFLFYDYYDTLTKSTKVFFRIFSIVSSVQSAVHRKMLGLIQIADPCLCYVSYKLMKRPVVRQADSF